MSRENPMSAPELILTHARIVTLDSEIPRAEALAVSGGRIIRVGTAQDVLALRGPTTRVEDLNGAVVVPGLVDAHAHLWSLARSLARVDLLGTRSYAEVVERVRQAASDAPEGTWVEGRGWDQNDWSETAFPTHLLLSEAVPNHPVVLQRVDGHALLVNARALDLAGLSSSTPDPPGGRMVRDANGRLTGVLVDNAMDPVYRVVPQPSPERMRSLLSQAMGKAVAAGLTGLHDMGIDDHMASVYDEMGRAGELKLRITAFWNGEADAIEKWLERAPVTDAHNGRLRIQGVKLFQDGALGSRGAALLEDYSDEPGNAGLVFHDADELFSLVRKADIAGYQVGVHAIGDRANRMVIDAYERLALERPDPARRPRIEHAQVVDLADMGRLAKLGVIAMVQPTHATSDMDWAEARLGPKRLRGAYAWRKLLREGVALGLGSDFPVESVRPLLGLYAAITRQNAAGHPAGGWDPDERLTPEEALRGFTQGAAFAGHREHDKGILAPGKFADLTVLDVDPLTDPPEALLRARILLTIVGGEVVYDGR